jgi:hypothetical protein
VDDLDVNRRVESRRRLDDDEFSASALIKGWVIGGTGDGGGDEDAYVDTDDFVLLRGSRGRDQDTWAGEEGKLDGQSITLDPLAFGDGDFSSKVTAWLTTGVTLSCRTEGDSCPNSWARKRATSSGAIGTGSSVGSSTFGATKPGFGSIVINDDEEDGQGDGDKEAEDDDDDEEGGDKEDASIGFESNEDWNIFGGDAEEGLEGGMWGWARVGSMESNDVGPEVPTVAAVEAALPTVAADELITN